MYILLVYFVNPTSTIGFFTCAGTKCKLLSMLLWLLLLGLSDTNTILHRSLFNHCMTYLFFIWFISVHKFKTKYGTAYFYCLVRWTLYRKYMKFIFSLFYQIVRISQLFLRPWETHVAPFTMSWTTWWKKRQRHIMSTACIGMPHI